MIRWSGVFWPDSHRFYVKSGLSRVVWNAIARGLCFVSVVGGCELDEGKRDVIVDNDCIIRGVRVLEEIEAFFIFVKNSFFDKMAAAL